MSAATTIRMRLPLAGVVLGALCWALILWVVL